MDKSFNEALTAAAWVYASQDQREPPTPDDIEGTMEDLRSPINAFLALADLVPRLPEIKQQARLITERDQALRELEQCHAKATCMCGDYIHGHGAWSGHSAVSMYDCALDEAITERDKARARVDQLEKESKDDQD